jgi:hypothetical protein
MSVAGMVLALYQNTTLSVCFKQSSGNCSCLFSGTSVTGSGIDRVVIKLVAVLLFIQGPQTQISSMCRNVKS